MKVKSEGLQHFMFAFIVAEDIIDTVKSLGAVHGVLEEPQLWAEASIVQTLIYKRSNHKKEKYFQGLKKVRSPIT